jgi:rhamnose utilization protein RhaD (predicted bifunctional aldolase and dehydrogenase)
MSLQELAAMSRRYGEDPSFVIAGGGNTSWKDDGILYVKGSGTALATIQAEGFVHMKRAALARILFKDYSANNVKREALVLKHMLAARVPGETRRPSVETLLHDSLPFAYVVHTHPTLVNGITCAKAGEQTVKELFGDDVVWIPAINPGYTLAIAVKRSLEEYRERTGRSAQVIFLQNHGLFVASDTPQGIDDHHRRICTTIESRITQWPDFSGECRESEPFRPDDYREINYYRVILTNISRLHWAHKAHSKDWPNIPKWEAMFLKNNEISSFLLDETAFQGVARSFTPDHIVYSGSDPLFVSSGENLRNAWEEHVFKKQRIPKIVAVQDMGVFGVGQSAKQADLALQLFRDTVSISVFSRHFGGPLFMEPDKVHFINNWEVESYRANQVS